MMVCLIGIVLFLVAVIVFLLNGRVSSDNTDWSKLIKLAIGCMVLGIGLMLIGYIGDQINQGKAFGQNMLKSSYRIGAPSGASFLLPNFLAG